MPRPIVIQGWHAAVAGLLFGLWLAGDIVFVALLDGAWLDCLEADSRAARRLEALVCSPRMLGQGALGWIAFLWMWGPVAALILWLSARRRRG